MSIIHVWYCTNFVSDSTVSFGLTCHVISSSKMPIVGLFSSRTCILKFLNILYVSIYHVCCNSWNTGNIAHRTVSDILGTRFSKTCDYTFSQLTPSLSVAFTLEDPKPPAGVRKTETNCDTRLGVVGIQ